MVVTDVPTRMSRTDEVHRITENVYKVRGRGACGGHLLLRLRPGGIAQREREAAEGARTAGNFIARHRAFGDTPAV